jgi:hypothetical protein
MDSNKIQVETLSLRMHCPGIEKRVRYLCKVQSMERDDILVETLPLTTHCPGIERSI